MAIGDWILEFDKFLTVEEVVKLLRATKLRAEAARVQGRKVAVRDYFVILLALATGLRVMEISALNCGDLLLEVKNGYLRVLNGKGHKRRNVFFDNHFKKHCQDYLNWKVEIGESVSPEAPLIISSNTGTHMTTRGLQRIFKRCAKNASLSPHHSIHCLRHTYACFLLKASHWNLRLVQKQLGHTHIKTTQVYADVMQSDIENTMKRMSQMYC